MDTRIEMLAKLVTNFIIVRGGDEKDAALLVLLREVLSVEC